MYTLIDLFSAFACGFVLYAAIDNVIEKRYITSFSFFILTIIDALFALQII